jgi:hypothetical protein
MDFDEAGDMPLANWSQQGSFECGSIPPIVEPDAGTQVCLGPIAREWIPWIAGAVDQLRNPSAWIVADDTAMYHTLRRVDTLMGLLFGGSGCEVPVMTRLDNCVLETSNDGGTTWTAVPGWADNFGQCVRDNVPPPIPPNPGADPIEQHACNLAGYLATEIIQLSMARMVSGITLMDPEVKIVRDIIDLLPGASLVLDTMTTSLSDFYNTVTGGTLSHYSDASTDGALWSAVTCAIYNAIRTVGYVNAANFAAVAVAIGAVSYAHAEVVNAIAFYFVQIGLPGIQALQVVGAIDTIDCTDCGGWCYEFDFTTAAGGWVTYTPGVTVWTNGVGFVGSFVVAQGGSEVAIFLTLPHDLFLTDCSVNFRLQDNQGIAFRGIDLNLDGVNVVEATGFPTVGDGAIVGHTFALGAIGDTIYVIARSTGGMSNAIFENVELRGTGPNPFGVTNCV